MQTTFLIKSMWLTGAFVVAAAVGYLTSQTGSVAIDDPILEKAIPVAPASEEPVNLEPTDPLKQQEALGTEKPSESKSLDETATPFVHSKAILKQSCQSCHRINPKQVGQKSPHLIDLTESPDQGKNQGLDTSFLGIHASDVKASLRKHLKLDPEIGAIVEKVIDESPAYHCGIEKHDVVVAIDDQPVRGEKSLLEKVRSMKPGTKILVEFIRAGQKETTQVVLGKQRTAQILNSVRIRGCPAQLNASTNCRDCHTAKTH